MNDQATRLRALQSENRNTASRRQSKAGAFRGKIIAVGSGKGGVGKTSICLSLGIALAGRGKKIVVMDGDLNLGNLDVLLGLTPKFTLRNVIAGQKSMEDILLDGPGGIKILPAGSGALELIDIESEVRNKLIRDFYNLDNDYDYLLIDTPAGIGRHVFDFLEIADMPLIVTTPEPTAIVDAYAIIKALGNRNSGISKLLLIVNLVSSKQEAEEIYEKLNMVIRRFLDRKIENWSYVLLDSNVGKAVREQQSFIELFPHCKAANCIFSIGDQIITAETGAATMNKPLNARLIKKNRISTVNKIL